MLRRRDGNYRQQGIPKKAAVIEKNLHRVKRLLISRGG